MTIPTIRNFTPQAPEFLNSAGVVGFLVLVASLVFVLIGIGIMWNARGRYPSFARAGASGGVALIGALMIVAAIGGMIFSGAQGALDFLVVQ